MLTQVSKSKETLEAERKRIKEELRAQVIERMLTYADGC